MRGTDAGIDGDHHAGDAELLRQTYGMQGSRATESDQGAAGGVLAVFDCVDASGAGHGLVDDLGDASGGFLGVHVEPRADIRHEGCVRQERVQRDLAAGEPTWVDAAEHHVGVSDGGGCAASGIAGGAWVGACAVGADGDPAQRIDAADGAAAGAKSRPCR